MVDCLSALVTTLVKRVQLIAGQRLPASEVRLLFKFQSLNSGDSEGTAYRYDFFAVSMRSNFMWIAFVAE